MTSGAWFAIARRWFLALAVEMGFGFPLAFSPGWANGWPFGLTVYSVWAAGMSILFSVLLVTAAAGVGAVAGAACCAFGVGRRRGWAAYKSWLACSSTLALVGGLWAFGQVCASALEMWPNGYNP